MLSGWTTSAVLFLCAASMSARKQLKTIILAQITKADLQKIVPSWWILDSTGVFLFFFDVFFLNLVQRQLSSPPNNKCFHAERPWTFPAKRVLPPKREYFHICTGTTLQRIDKAEALNVSAIRHPQQFSSERRGAALTRTFLENQPWNLALWKNLSVTQPMYKYTFSVTVKWQMCVILLLISWSKGQNMTHLILSEVGFYHPDTTPITSHNANLEINKSPSIRL